jgi:hypothetical protein
VPAASTSVAQNTPDAVPAVEVNVCVNCRKAFKNAKGVDVHRRTCKLNPENNHMPKNVEPTEDHVYNYAIAVTHMGLLHASYQDAIKERDGGRIAFLNKVFTVLWKNNPNTVKYAIQGWFFTTLVEVLSSDAQAYEIIHNVNRTVNREGVPRGGAENDLDREWDNGVEKPLAKHMGSARTDKGAVRVTKAGAVFSTLLHPYNQAMPGYNFSNDKRTGKQKKISIKADVLKVVAVLREVKVFRRANIPRQHPHFPRFQKDFYKHPSMKKLAKWVEKRVSCVHRRGKRSHMVFQKDYFFEALERFNGNANDNA